VLVFTKTDGSIGENMQNSKSLFCMQITHAKGLVYNGMRLAGGTVREVEYFRSDFLVRMPRMDVPSAVIRIKSSAGTSPPKRNSMAAAMAIAMLFINTPLSLR
jgi:hypothetical protein